MARLSSCFFLLLLFIASLAAAQKADASITAHCCSGPTISVTGAGKRSFPTSIAVIRLGVEANGTTAKEAQAMIAAKSVKLTAFLKAEKVDKLQTTGVSLSNDRNYLVRPSPVVGYSGSNSVSFEVPVDRAGALLDGAVNNGASTISDVSFTATPEVNDDARKNALADATKAARAEAEVVAAALGRSVGDAKKVKIDGEFGPQEDPIVMAVSATRAATSSLVAGDSSVSSRVSIVFELGYA